MIMMMMTSNLELLDGHLVVPVSFQQVWLGKGRIIFGKQKTQQTISSDMCSSVAEERS